MDPMAYHGTKLQLVADEQTAPGRNPAVRHRQTSLWRRNEARGRRALHGALPTGVAAAQQRGTHLGQGYRNI